MNNVFPIGVESLNRNSLLSNLLTTHPGVYSHDFQTFRLMHRPFGKMKRKLSFILNIVTNFDHGAIPAEIQLLKKI